MRNFARLARNITRFRSTAETIWGAPTSDSCQQGHTHTRTVNIHCSCPQPAVEMSDFLPVYLTTVRQVSLLTHCCRPDWQISPKGPPTNDGNSLRCSLSLSLKCATVAARQEEGKKKADAAHGQRRQPGVTVATANWMCVPLRWINFSRCLSK